MKGFLMKYLIFCSFLIACSVSINPGEERINNRNESKAVIAITAGFYHTCVILIDKSVKCSGNNAYGQTGGGTSSYDRTISGTEGNPLSGKTATHIAAGGSHTCAILTNKSVKCWGSNEYSQTGGGFQNAFGTLTISGTEGDPLSGKTATHIAAGGSHTCAILTNESVKCWGSNGYSQLGGDTNSSYDRTISGTAGDPLSGKTATHIAAGGSHTCAILMDKSVKCWGGNGYGQTGGGTSGGHSKTISGTAGDPLSGKNRYSHCSGVTRSSCWDSRSGTA